MQNHNDTIIKQRSEDFFRKIYTSPFIVRVRKGYSRFACERELETEHNCNILTPHSYGQQRCVFLVLQGCSTGGPEAHPLLAFSTTSYQQLLWTSTLPTSNSIGGPEGPFGLVWLSLPHLVYNSNCNCLTSVLTELYNSSTPTQSPTRSLEWHV